MSSSPTDIDALVSQYGGKVAAPSTASPEADIDAAVAKYGGTVKDAPQKPGFLRGLWEQTGGAAIEGASHALDLSTLGDAATHLGNGDLKEAAKSYGDWIVKNVADQGPAGRIAQGLIRASVDQARKTHDAVRNGDFKGALAHAGASTVPIFAPGADAIDEAREANPQTAAEALGSGPHNIRHALGTVAGNIGSVVAPEIAEAALPAGAALTVVPKMDTLTAGERSAVDFAKVNDIPIPAATATGNKFVKGAQAIAANQPLGAGIAKRAGQATREALTSAGSNIEDKVAPVATEESAGTGVAKALEEKISGHSRDAQSAYSKLADIENDPAHLKSIQVGEEANPELDKLSQTLSGKAFKDLSKEDQQKVVKAAKDFNVDPTMKPITKDVALPVDMRPVKEALRPIYDQIKAQLPITQQQSSLGLKAIENIINGDDHASASTAEANLGAVKAIQREVVNPKAKYLAGQVVTKFAPAVDDAVSAAGTDATTALQEGRALTRAKYATKETLDQLPTEPVRIFNRLTANDDISINLLRDVKTKVPNSIPALGRAAIQGLVESATAEEGKTPGPAAAAANWGRIGDSTKEILFPDVKMRNDLDNFFSLAKKVAENPNPSGSAVVGSLVPGGLLAIHSPVTGVAWLLSGYGTAKLLYSPVGVKLLTEGLRAPLKNAPRSVSVANQLLSLAGKEAKEISPKSADKQIQSAQDIVDGGDKITPSAGGKVQGLLTPGNIDITKRPDVKNADGSRSTVRSMSFEDNGKEVLVPTVIGNKVVSDDEAIAHYRKTGEHLGIFDSPADATAYAKQLHDDYQSGKIKNTPPATFKVGDRVNLPGVGEVEIKKINEDGTFDY